MTKIYEHFSVRQTLGKPAPDLSTWPCSVHYVTVEADVQGVIRTADLTFLVDSSFDGQEHNAYFPVAGYYCGWGETMEGAVVCLAHYILIGGLCHFVNTEDPLSFYAQRQLDYLNELFLPKTA